MTALVKIGGADVDVEDPCALYQALYALKLKIIAGEQIEEVQVRSPATQRVLRVTAANIKALDAELMRLSDACRKKSGLGRSRFAIQGRFTPY
jgi:hypothetical protein